MVAIDDKRRATCDSRAIVTWSRKRRCVRSLTTRKNQVAAAAAPSPTAAAEQAVDEELEQEGEESVRQRRQERQPEGHGEQQRLGLVAALESPPEGAQGGGEGDRLSRGHRGSSPPPPHPRSAAPRTRTQ